MVVHTEKIICRVTGSQRRNSCQDYSVVRNQRVNSVNTRQSRIYNLAWKQTMSYKLYLINSLTIPELLSFNQIDYDHRPDAKRK